MVQIRLSFGMALDFAADGVMGTMKGSWTTYG